MCMKNARESSSYMGKQDNKLQCCPNDLQTKHTRRHANLTCQVSKVASVEDLKLRIAEGTQSKIKLGFVLCVGFADRCSRKDKQANEFQSSPRLTTNVYCKTQQFDLLTCAGAQESSQLFGQAS